MHVLYVIYVLYVTACTPLYATIVWCIYSSTNRLSI